jgi:hypothetical protein
VADYRAGLTSPELAVRYGVAKTAVLRVLHDRGLAVRKPGLSAEEVKEATRLRGHGLSYAAIGYKFGVYGSTVWRALQQSPDQNKS